MANETSNPLIVFPALPNGAPPFGMIEQAHFLPALRHHRDVARAALATIRDNPAPADFANTIEAFEFAGEDLGYVTRIFQTYCSSASDDALRAIEEVVERENAAFRSDIFLDAGLFARVKAVYDQRATLTLDGEQARLLDETMKSFRRQGALLPDAAKERLRAIDARLAALTTLFSNNLVKATDAYRREVHDEAELAGLPERAKRQYRAAAEEIGLKDAYLIRLEPFPFDVFAYAKNRALREEVWRADAGCCFHDAYDNTAPIMEIVRLRDERAKLLGYPTHAAYVLEDRMAETQEAVSAFLEKNLATYKPAAERELAELKAFAKERDGFDDLKPWDMPYYRRLLREKTFSFETETLRPYFELSRVLEGLKNHAEKLFGIQLVDVGAEKYPRLYDDVRVYEVMDPKKGTLLGLLYSDPYARPGRKRGGAWMEAVRSAGLFHGAPGVPIVTNDCNFAKPSPEQPTLLSIDEVETAFHEFGHALHALLGEARYPSLASPNVLWDFVELPSQIQENWVKQKATLDTFARHLTTNELLPQETVDLLQRMQRFHAATFGLRQTYLGLLDFTYYTTPPDALASPEALEKAVDARATLIERPVGLMSTSFSHIFAGGYDAGYYSYKWAEVLEADVFARFEEKGLYDPAMATGLRTLLAKGGTEKPMKLFVDLMGREPDPQALFRREGLA
jgi:peptidyl-dipeptidase Dcp